MSAVHVLPAPTTTSVTLSPEEATRRIEAVLDAVDASQVASASEAARAVAGLDRVLARAQSIRLKVLAAADRADVAADSGLTDTGAWLAGVSRTAGADAASQVRLASALDAGLQLTGAAMDAGEVSVEHAAIIAATTARLPGTLSDGQRDKVESVLVREAKRVDPARLRRAAKRALRLAELDAQAATAHLDAEQRSEEQQALDRTRLAIHDNRDGTMSGHFTVPALAGAILRKTIQQIASPRRHAARARAAGSQPDMGIDWGQRFGEAFVELLEHLPTDRLGGKVAASVVVTIDQQTLTDAGGVATLTPATTCPPGRFAASPVAPAFSPPSSAARPCLWISAARPGSSPSTSGSLSRRPTTSAPPTGATGPTPGPNSTTRTHGPRAGARGRPTSCWPCHCAVTITAGFTTRPTTRRSPPTPQGGSPSATTDGSDALVHEESACSADRFSEGRAQHGAG